jgi:hypothetical protein
VHVGLFPMFQNLEGAADGHNCCCHELRMAYLAEALGWKAAGRLSP